MRRRRSTPRRSERVRDEAFLAEVRLLPCCLRSASKCSGTSDPDHAGKRPLGRKASDDTAIPMCRRHHDERTDYAGYFKGWDAARMRLWCDERIAETRVTVAAQLAGVGGVFAW